MLFGSCIQAVGSSSCLLSGGYDIASVDGHYGPSQQPNYVYEGTLSYSYSASGNTNSADNESTSGSAASQQIYGSYVAITAATIDVNGSITVGKATQYSATVGPALQAVINDLAKAIADFNAFNAGAQDEGWLPGGQDDYQFQKAAAAGVDSSNYLQYVYGTESLNIAPGLTVSAGAATLGVTATYNAEPVDAVGATTFRRPCGCANGHNGQPCTTSPRSSAVGARSARRYQHPPDRPQKRGKDIVVRESILMLR